MRNRVLCLACIVAVLAMFAAPLSLSEEGMPYAGTKIRFSSFQTGPVEEDWVNVQFPRFLEETGIEVEHVFIAHADTISTLMTWTAAGTAPDASMLSSYYQNALAAQGLLLDLDAYVAANRPDINFDRFFPNLLNVYRYGGVQYALPSDFDLSVTWFNKDMFDAAGIEYLSGDWTWDDCYETAKALTSGEGPSKIYGAEVPFFEMILWQAGADYISEDGLTCTINTPEAKNAYNYVLGMMADGIVPRTLTAEGGFGAGRAAMHLGNGPWYAFYVLNDVEFAWDIAPIPQEAHKSMLGSGSSFAVLNSSGNIDAAFEFINWFLSDEQQFIRAKQFSWFPPASTVLEFPGFEEDDVLNMNAEQKRLVMAEAEYSRDQIVVANQNEIRQIISREESLIWSGEKDIEDALATMEAEITPLLAP